MLELIMQDNNPVVPNTNQVPFPQTTDLPPFPVTVSQTPATTPPPPSMPPSMPEMIVENPKKKSPVMMISIILVIVAILAAVSYFLGKMYLGQKSEAVPTEIPTEVESYVPEETEAPVAQTGIVKGKLCYPSESLPKGQIIAKNTLTGEIVAQEYAGTEAGALSTYELSLNEGTYHVKYMISDTLSGFYNTCNGSDGTVCSQDATQINMEVKVMAGQTTEAIDLCDFYYNETQKAALDASF